MKRMKMMKRVSCTLAVMVFCLLFPCPVKADVIWEPMDSFYQEHSSECIYVGRSYTANGPDGKVILYKSPVLPEAVETWENGKQVYIHFAYEDSDGISWGVYDDYNGTVGWMPMDYMELVYDSIAFREEHAGEIVEESGDVDEAYLGEEIYFWKYPGSEVYYAEKTDSYMPSYQSVYTDEDGNRWGHIGYYFGHRDVWVCLDAPAADFEELYPDGVAQKNIQVEEDDRSVSDDASQTKTGPGENEDASEIGQQDEEAADKVESRQEGERIVPKPDYSVMILAVILVVAVTAVTAGLLFVLKRGKK